MISVINFQFVHSNHGSDGSLWGAVDIHNSPASGDDSCQANRQCARYPTIPNHCVIAIEIQSFCGDNIKRSCLIICGVVLP